MKKYTLLSIFFQLFCYLVNAQATQDFIIEANPKSLENSKYNHLTVIDDRQNTYLGFVQTGAFNKYRSLIDNPPIKEQMQQAFSESLVNNTQNGDMILYLRSFSFAEVTKSFSEHGYFAFAADLYGNNGNGFSLLQKIDTVLDVKGMDVTKKMLTTGKSFYNSFIAANANRSPLATAEVLNSEQIINTKEREKALIPVYNTDTFVDGIYYNYASFKEQKPDMSTYFLKYKNDVPIEIRETETSKNKIDARKFYAIIDKNQLFINDGKGFRPLTKLNNDFHFKGIGVVNPNSTDVLVASMLFGVIGGILASSNNTQELNYIIDYATGDFITVEEK